MGAKIAHAAPCVVLGVQKQNKKNHTCNENRHEYAVSNDKSSLGAHGRRRKADKESLEVEIKPRHTEHGAG